MLVRWCGVVWEKQHKNPKKLVVLCERRGEAFFQFFLFLFLFLFFSLINWNNREKSKKKKKN